MKVKVRIPATSANLGPGFDTLGIALNYYDEYQVETTASGLEIEVIGEGAGDIPTDETNLVFKALSLVFEKMNETLPGIKLVTTNNIPTVEEWVHRAQLLLAELCWPLDCLENSTL